ncbi:MAG TPA: hypothetical protein VFV34_01105 [Blastocatellia bacterium]|nr:hypothetical protein [Blastocatellia bacterium]
MRIFGKSLSEYIAFQKIFLILIAVFFLVRLGLSLGGVQVSVAKWISVSVIELIGFVYYALRVYPSGFGSYKELLVLLLIQNLLANVLIAGAIVLAIVTGKDNIYSLPEFSGGGDGKTWQHAGAHIVLAGIVLSVLLWLVGMLVVLITKKVGGGKTASAGAA